jgi:hypothetical protein
VPPVDELAANESARLGVMEIDGGFGASREASESLPLPLRAQAVKPMGSHKGLLLLPIAHPLALASVALTNSRTSVKNRFVVRMAVAPFHGKRVGGNGPAPARERFRFGLRPPP